MMKRKGNSRLNDVSKRVLAIMLGIMLVLSIIPDSVIASVADVEMQQMEEVDAEEIEENAEEETFEESEGEEAVENEAENADQLDETIESEVISEVENNEESTLTEEITEESDEIISEENTTEELASEELTSEEMMTEELTTEQEEIRAFANDTFGIKIEAIDVGALHDASEFVVQELSSILDETTINSIVAEEGFHKDTVKIKEFSMFLSNGNQEVSLAGKAKVSIPISAIEEGDQYAIYQCDKDGIAHKILIQKGDEVLTFEVTSLGQYVVISNTEKIVTELVNEEFEITITTKSEDALKEVAGVKVEDKTSDVTSSIIDKITSEENIKKSNMITKTLNIELVDENAKEVQPEGTVTVSMMIPLDMDSETFALYYIGNGEDIPIKVNGKMEDGYFIFDRTHFCQFCAVANSFEEQKDETQATESAEIIKTDGSNTLKVSDDEKALKKVVYQYSGSKSYHYSSWYKYYRNGRGYDTNGNRKADYETHKTEYQWNGSSGYKVLSSNIPDAEIKISYTGHYTFLLYYLDGRIQSQEIEMLDSDINIEQPGPSVIQNSAVLTIKANGYTLNNVYYQLTDIDITATSCPSEFTTWYRFTKTGQDASVVAINGKAGYKTLGANCDGKVVTVNTPGWYTFFFKYDEKKTKSVYVLVSSVDTTINVTNSIESLAVCCDTKEEPVHVSYVEPMNAPYVEQVYNMLVVYNNESGLKNVKYQLSDTDITSGTISNRYTTWYNFVKTGQGYDGNGILRSDSKKIQTVNGASGYRAFTKNLADSDGEGCRYVTVTQPGWYTFLLRYTNQEGEAKTVIQYFLVSDEMISNAGPQVDKSTYHVTVTGNRTHLKSVTYQLTAQANNSDYSFMNYYAYGEGTYYTTSSIYKSIDSTNNWLVYTRIGRYLKTNKRSFDMTTVSPWLKAVNGPDGYRSLQGELDDQQIDLTTPGWYTFRIVYDNDQVICRYVHITEADVDSITSSVR